MLKPTDLGLASIPRTIDEYHKLLNRKIEFLPNKNLIRILKKINQAKNGDKIDLKGLSKEDLREINIYYSECVSPVLIQKNRFLGNISPKTWCYLPSSATTGAYDFFMITCNEKVHLISNKFWGKGNNKGNVLKILDVLKFVDNDPKLYKKWKNIRSYKVLKTLDKYSATTGGMMAIRNFYPKLVDVPIKDMDKLLELMIHNDMVIKHPPKSVIRFINRFPPAKSHYLKNKKKLTCSVVGNCFDKILCRQSKKENSFNDIYYDVAGKLLFMRFRLDPDGLINFKLDHIKWNSEKKAFLRNKNGVERRSKTKGVLRTEKLGFMV